MNKNESVKFFEEWLRAYANHLHLIRQGPRVDVVQPTESKPPVAAQKSTVAPPHPKTTNR